MVEQKPSKLTTRVRSPVPAPVTLAPDLSGAAPAQQCVRGFFIPARRLARRRYRPTVPKLLGTRPGSSDATGASIFRPLPVYTNPSILKTWQHDDERVPPTCYDARNPAMPWLPADELAYEDGEDRALARDWVCTGGQAESIGGLQKPTKQPMAPTTAAVPPTPDIFQLSILQQLAFPAKSRKK